MRDQDIAPDDLVFRRIRPQHLVKDPKAPGGIRASAAAFTDETDGSSMSGYLNSLVLDLGRTAQDVVHGKSANWGVAAIPVEALIAEEQVVALDPITNPQVPHPCDLAHVEVHGVKEPKGRRDRISRASPLVYIIP